MSTDFQNYPDLLEIKTAIKKFKANGWPVFDGSENIEDFAKKITDQITSEIGIFPNFLNILKPHQFPFKIFRVRELGTISNKELFTEHSYPPPYLTKFGRCNFPHHPVFYCSNNPITALVEVARETNWRDKQFCISVWKIIDSDNDLIFESFLNSSLHPNNSFAIIPQALQGRIQEPFENKLSEDKRLALIEFLKYVDSEFINDQNYTLSASIAHRRLYANHNLGTDILMYPSTQSQRQTINMAIKPNFVDNCMQVLRFYIVTLKDYDSNNGVFKISISQYGYVENNTILWRNAKEGDYTRAFKEDFAAFISQDEVPEVLQT
ncbi:MAG: hypothetical protein JWN78_777 [Bacteroidota bacterium]|nr:hypothetical protein [Bacteroidota bacterium]